MSAAFCIFLVKVRVCTIFFVIDGDSLELGTFVWVVVVEVWASAVIWRVVRITLIHFSFYQLRLPVTWSDQVPDLLFLMQNLT